MSPSTTKYQRDEILGPNDIYEEKKNAQNHKENHLSKSADFVKRNLSICPRHTLIFALRALHKKIDALHQHWHKTAFFRFLDYKQIFDLKAIKIKKPI